jgi:iron complex transport system permease protein
MYAKGKIVAAKNKLIYLALSLVLLGTMAMALLTGPVHVPLRDIFYSSIIQLRLARILLALITGAGLSVAGVIFQALLRNPLAEPYLLGISSGAGLGAATAIIAGLTALTVWSVPALAFAAGLGTIILVYALSRTSGGLVPIYTLLLTGVIVNAIFGSLLMFLASTSSSENLHSVVWWLLGSLQIFDWTLLRIAAVVIAAGLLITLLFSRTLNLMTLGEESAAHLGLRVERTKLLFFALASLITGATVAACGLIGFVGLLVPHFMRLLLGPDHRRLVPACALAGGAFLILADMLARTLIAPLEIPIGVVTALLGGPVLLFLLRRKSASGRM